MAEKCRLEMLPPYIGALYKAGGIEKWIRNWWGRQPLIKLYHVGWFTQGKVSGSYSWSPPPAAMKTAREIIAEARHKKPYVWHRIFFPLSIKHLRRKYLMKDTHLMFTIPKNLSVWPTTFHDTLYITLILPIIRRSNWKGP